jgi:steroid 5-alpha reductase family enzyme
MISGPVIVIAAVSLSLVMGLAWWLVVRSGRSGWADTFWSYGTGLVGVIAVWWAAGGRVEGRALLVVALLALWSLRLGTHIARRTLSGGDDPRYAELRSEWGERYRSQLFVFLHIQGAAALVLVIAVLAAAGNPAPLGVGDLAGIAIALFALAGEAVSDAQLNAFKAGPANRGGVCDSGLWSLSRHPNYFFEWLYWLAYLPIGIGLAYPWGWLTLLAPLMMYWLLVHVSGIPPLEAHMLRSRGDSFLAYQQRVRAFWPLPR